MNKAILRDVDGNAIFSKQFNGNHINVIVTKHTNSKADFYVSHAVLVKMNNFNKVVSLDCTNLVNMFSFTDEQEAYDYAVRLIIDQLANFISMLVTRERS